jgi:hypothetical protein
LIPVVPDQHSWHIDNPVHNRIGDSIWPLETLISFRQVHAGPDFTAAIYPPILIMLNTG